MPACLQLVSYGRGGASGRVTAEEAEEVGGRHLRGSVQNEELDLGAWGEDPWVRVHTGLAEFSVQKPHQTASSQPLINSGPGGPMLSSALLGHLH